MSKKLLFFLIAFVFLFNNLNAQEEQKEEGSEIKEFKVTAGEPLDYKVLTSLNKSPSDMEQPGFVTISQVFKEGNKVGEAKWENYMPHAGKNEFIDTVRSIINTWEYSKDSKATGVLFYTVATNGTIKINLKSLSLPNYIKYKFATAEFLVKVKGYEKQNIRVIMHKGQTFGVIEESFFSKLGATYVGIFSVVALVLLFSIIFTMKSTTANLEPKDKTFVEIITKLWINNTLKLTIEKNLADGTPIKTDRIIDEENPDLDEELKFIDQLSDALINGVIEKQDQANFEKIGPEYAVSIDYAALGKDIKNVIKGLNTDEEKESAIVNVKNIIWQKYSVVYIQKAKDLCIKNKNTRICRVFLAGLENHLNNKDAWYSSSEIDRAVDKTAASELEQMKGWLDGLWVIGSVAPMVGLFGTVTGISTAFARISETSAGMEQSELITQLAGGINTALYTTIVGLVFGISATIIYYAFKVRLDNTSTHWEQRFVDITNNF